MPLPAMRPTPALISAPRLRVQLLSRGEQLARSPAAESTVYPLSSTFSLSGGLRRSSHLTFFLVSYPSTRVHIPRMRGINKAFEIPGRAPPIEAAKMLLSSKLSLS